jgi:hypothetical protein
MLSEDEIATFFTGADVVNAANGAECAAAMLQAAEAEIRALRASLP